MNYERGEAMSLSYLNPATESFDAAVRYARLAEELGYESINSAHIAARDSFTLLSALAMATERISLATAVAPIYHRSPASMAQTAATVDEISGGRFRLGLGVGHRVTMGGWHGQEIGKPTVEMREYTAIVRAILAGEQPPAGQRWSSTFAFVGFLPRADIPIYQAALSPGMLRLAGEIADGVILWLCNPSYIRDVVVPAIREGRERAQLPLEGFDIVAAVPGSLTADRAATFATMRTELVPYFGLPFYRAMIERTGFAEDIAAFDAAAGDIEAMKAAISDRFLEELTAIGDEVAVRAGLERYREAGTTSPCLGPVSGGDAEATLRAGAPGA
jgi:alkanesulfonate monooxygenase SsuD/methylene tetrahydromethanopterin reductase-like flavin-dependent oxidoreductase (luciferase family)